MAAFVQAATGFNSSGSNTNLFTSNFGVACTAGNALFIGVYIDSGSATVSAITDTAGVHNTYTLVDSFAGAWGKLFFYQALNITANAGVVYQVQVTEGSALDGQIFAQEWSGFATSGTLKDTSVTNSGNSANPTTSSSLTTSFSNEVIFSLMMLQSQTNTWTAGTGYSNLSNVASNFTSAGMESKALAAAGSTTAAFGMTNTGIPYIQYTVGMKTTASTGGGANHNNLLLMGVG